MLLIRGVYQVGISNAEFWQGFSWDLSFFAFSLFSFAPSDASLLRFYPECTPCLDGLDLFCSGNSYHYKCSSFVFYEGSLPWLRFVMHVIIFVLCILVMRFFCCLHHVRFFPHNAFDCNFLVQ